MYREFYFIATHARHRIPMKSPPPGAMWREKNNTCIPKVQVEHEVRTKVVEVVVVNE